MNLVKLQDKKLIHINLLHFSALTTKDHKEKLKKNLVCHCNKKIKYLGINLRKEAKIMYSGILSRGLSHEALKKKNKKLTQVKHLMTPK